MTVAFFLSFFLWLVEVQSAWQREVWIFCPWLRRDIKGPGCKNVFSTQVLFGHLCSRFDGGTDEGRVNIFVLSCMLLLCWNQTENASSDCNFAGFHRLLFQCDFSGVTCEVRLKLTYHTLAFLWPSNALCTLVDLLAGSGTWRVAKYVDVTSLGNISSLAPKMFL